MTSKLKSKLYFKCKIYLTFQDVRPICHMQFTSIYQYQFLEVTMLVTEPWYLSWYFLDIVT